MRKRIHISLGFPTVLYFMVLCSMMGCTPQMNSTYTEQGIAISWAEMTLYITQFTPANSPTYASRCVGYIGLTMYESIVHGYPSYQSIAGQLNGLDNLPQPEENANYHWPIAFNAAQAAIIKSLYNQTSDMNKAKIDSLEQEIYNYLVDSQRDQAVIARSVQYGQAVASAIFEWSKTDGGHRGYLRNFDKSFVHPDRPGSWKPPLYAQSFSHHPLHPYWGENRTFLKENADLPLPEMIPYDTTKNSPYYQQFMAVYEKEQELTQKEKEIAIWWSDDPDDTFTPPGHSFYLATIAIKAKNPDFITCAETFAKVGMSVADAFINCWKWKYHFFSERPNTFVPQFIDPEWESFWPDPPFPSFPSGHAIQAAAMAVALADVFGNELTFIDSAHVGRERDRLRDTDFVERPFTSFWGVAQGNCRVSFLRGHTYVSGQ